MNVELITDIAAVIGAIALIVSLIFVAIELKKNVEQSIATNWYERMEKNQRIRHLLLDKNLAALVERGDQSFYGLDDMEKVQYSAYMELVLFNLMFNVVASSHASPRAKHLINLDTGKNESENWNKARIRYYFGKKGVVEWFKQFDEIIPVPPHFHMILSSALT